MKITQFDDRYTQKLGQGGTTLVSGTSGGSNSGIGGDVTGSLGNLSVIGLRSSVSLGSNLGTGVAVGDTLTIISTAGTPVARFATPSNSGSVSYGSNANSVGNANAGGASTLVSRADHVHMGVASIAKSGSAALVGAVTLTGGSNVTLTQSGNDISIASTGGGGGGALTFISQTVLGSPASTLDVGSIPNTYKDLVVVLRVRGTDSGTGLGVKLRLGSGGGTIDSGANYAYYQTFAGWTGGSNTGTAGTSADLIAMPNTSAASGDFGHGRLELLHYADTSRYKGWIGHGFEVDGSGVLQTVCGGEWKDTTHAIDTVRVIPSAGNFDTGSAMTVYGRG